jgi:hemerythrin
MNIQWNNSLTTGWEWQDNQHKELFKRINDLLDALSKGQAPAKVKGVFDFLDQYVVSHFGAEERWMTANAYPAVAEHKREHQAFITELKSYRQELDSKGTSVPLALKLQTWLGGWLRTHIGTIDRKLGSFVTSRN